MANRPTFRFAVDLRLACAATLGLLLIVLGDGASAVSAQGAAAKPSSPAGEGIAVRGAWTITVREPDGTLVERREFQNALTQRGVISLTALLQAPKPGNPLDLGMTSGRWAIVLGPRADSREFPWDGQTAGLHQSGVLQSDLPVTSTNLTTTVICCVSLEVDGSTTAVGNGWVGKVHTYLQLCQGNVSPVDCRSVPSPTYHLFTSHDLSGAPGTPDAPIHLVPRQIIQTTVKISFSAATPQPPSQ